jgi:hypothetical protein
MKEGEESTTEEPVSNSESRPSEGYQWIEKFLFHYRIQGRT